MARHGGTTRVAGTLVVLLSLLVPDAIAFTSARSSVLAIRGLSDSAEDSADAPRAIALDLMHAHHVDSPYMMQQQRNLTLKEKVQHSVANSRRRLRSRYASSATVFTSPLQESFQEYTMKITVGTPPRTFVAIADTGSDLVWLQCTNSTCNDTNCLQTPDPPFNPAASSSFVPVPCNVPACGFLAIESNELPCPSTGICTYKYIYGGGSFTAGELGGENFTFTFPNSSTTVVPGIAFGCGTDDESAGLNGTDGLVGLGQGPLSLVSQLADRFIIDHVFSYCLVDFTAAATQTSPLLLGTPGPVAKSYTPLLPSNGVLDPLYYVNLVGITVNGKAICYPSDTFDISNTTGDGGFVVDSGTTVTMLAEAAYRPFLSAISALITYPVANIDVGLDLCYNTSGVYELVFPIVEFQFENVNVTLGTNNTFVPVDNEGTYCFAFASAAGLFVSIYGNIQQSHFEIAFDVLNKRVGFGPGAC